MRFVPLLHVGPVNAELKLRGGLQIHPVTLPSRDKDAPRAAAVYRADCLKRLDAVGVQVIIGVKANIQNRDIESGAPQRVLNHLQVLADDDLGGAARRAALLSI